jgi:hypothetical protein
MSPETKVSAVEKLHKSKNKKLVILINGKTRLLVKIKKKMELFENTKKYRNGV